MNISAAIKAKLEVALLSKALKSAKSITKNIMSIEYKVNGQNCSHAEYTADQKSRSIMNSANANYSPKKGSEIYEQAKQLNATRAASKPSPAPSPAQAMPTAKEIASAIIEAQAVNAAAALVKTRAAFNAMTPAQRMEFSKAGGRIS